MIKKLTVFTKYKSMFDIFIYVFIIIGIDICREDNKIHPIFKFGMKFIFYIASAIGVITGTFHFGFFLDEFDMDIFSPIAYCYSGLLFSFILHRKKNDYLRLIQILSKYDLTRKHTIVLNKKRKKHIILLLICLLIKLTLLILSIYLTVTVDNKQLLISKYPTWASKLQKIFSNFNKIHSIMLLLTSFFCCYLPLLAYVTFYYSICSHIIEITAKVKNMISISPISFELNHKVYSNMKCLVELVDSKLKYVNCYGILAFASLIYFNIFSKFPDIFYFKGHRIIDIILVVIIVMLAIKAINEAGEIPVVNQQILTELSESPFNKNFLSHRIAFSLQIKQGLHLTVGGMIAVTKGWSLIFIGSIMTYSLLIKSL